jgi:hypothetical protein
MVACHIKFNSKTYFSPLSSSVSAVALSTVQWMASFSCSPVGNTHNQISINLINLYLNFSKYEPSVICSRPSISIFIIRNDVLTCENDDFRIPAKLQPHHPSIWFCTIRPNNVGTIPWCAIEFKIRWLGAGKWNLKIIEWLYLTLPYSLYLFPCTPLQTRRLNRPHDELNVAVAWSGFWRLRSYEIIFGDQNLQ